ncbi:MAG: TIM barrel protein [Candidatus Sigynarchaeota archaeon]
MALEKNIKSIVHFMAYPGPRLGRSTQLGEAPETYMLETLQKIIKDGYFTGVEITLIKDPAIRKKVADLLRINKMYVTFCAQIIQLINEDHLIAPTDISSNDEIERKNAVQRIKDYIDEAGEVGAKHFQLWSGQDPGTAAGLGARRQAIRQLTRSLVEICAYAKKNYSNMKISLCMFDRLEGKAPQHKNQLIGPTTDAVHVADIVKRENGYENFGLLYDLSHMFFLKDGFEHETPNVLRELAPYLNFVHIANCVTDPQHEDYGDLHVSMDHPQGAVTPQVLTEFVKVLNEIGYEGPIGFELLPRGRQLSESVINVAKAMFKEACQQMAVNYALGDFRFKTRKFFPEKLFFDLTQFRVDHPEIVGQVAKARVRRKALTTDGKLVILAADHPARLVTRVGEDPYRMGDRQQYIGRIVRALLAPNVDGVMTTPDIMDDLFILEHMLKQAGAGSLLDNKVLIGCTNRGGLSGSTHEMDDRLTAYKIKDIKDLGLDGAKMMFRVDLKTPQARYSQATIELCANLVRECNQLDVPAFIEPLMVEQTPQGYKVVMDTNEMLRVISVASALGGTSRNTWLKIPYVNNYELIARATSNPILILGGDSTGNPTDIIEAMEKGMGAGENVRGAMVGRNMLYPGNDDPYATAAAVGSIVHGGLSAEEAIVGLASLRGKNMDFFAGLLGTK